MMMAYVSKKIFELFREMFTDMLWSTGDRLVQKKLKNEEASYHGNARYFLAIFKARG